MNPYAPSVGETIRPPRAAIAFGSSAILAAISATACGTDLVRAFSWYLRTGEAAGLAGIWIGVILVVASFLCLFAEWTARPKFLRLVPLLIIPLVLFSIYLGCQVAALPLSTFLGQIRQQPMTLLGLAWFPATWFYAGAVMTRAIRPRHAFDHGH